MVLVWVGDSLAHGPPYTHPMGEYMVVWVSTRFEWRCYSTLITHDSAIHVQCRMDVSTSESLKSSRWVGAWQPERPPAPDGASNH